MTNKWLSRSIAAPGPYLTLCLNESEFKTAMRHLRADSSMPWVNENANATMHSLHNSGGRLCCIVCLAVTGKLTPIEIAGILVHEAVHVWQAYADNIGERFPGAEQEAYAIQAISQELMTEYARRVV